MKSASALIGALLAFALVGGVLAGCSSTPTVATVNGQTITAEQLQAQLDGVKSQYPQMFAAGASAASLDSLKKQLLDSMVDQILVAQAAKDMGISVTDAQVSKQFDLIRKQFATDAAYQDALKKFGTTDAKLKDQIRQQLTVQAVTAKLASQQTVTPAEIKSYYDKNKSMFTDQAGKRVAHILVSSPTVAASLLAQVKAGSDFGALAKKYSIDKASAANGGDLGWPTTPYVAQFQAAVDKLTKTGQISPVVKSTYGYHIIKLEDARKASVKPLSEVSDQIKQIIQQQRQADAYQKFIADLRKKYKSEIKIDTSALTAVTASAATTATK